MSESEWDQDPIPRDERDGGQSHRIRFLILGAAAVLALGYMIYAAFPGNTHFFLTISEFMEKEEAQDGRLVRVSGVLVEDSVSRDGNSTFSRFRLADKEGAAGREHLAAIYTGVLPDLFFNPHSEIILQGSYGPDRVFQADTILVKCPSKYRSLQDELESG